MATDWEGSPRTESRMFALGFETKQKKWCRETCRVCIWPSTHPSTELSCRASHQSCHSRLMVGSPGPTAWAGQGLSPQPHQPHRGCQHGLDGMWHCLPTLSPARSSLGPAHTCTSATAPLGQLQLLGLLPWLSHSTAQLVSSHRRNFQTPHSTTNQAQLPCDRHTQLWWGSYSLSIMSSSCQEERRNKTQFIFKNTWEKKQWQHFAFHISLHALYFLMILHTAAERCQTSPKASVLLQHFPRLFTGMSVCVWLWTELLLSRNSPKTFSLMNHFLT